jgi:hypothetical protein
VVHESRLGRSRSTLLTFPDFPGVAVKPKTGTQWLEYHDTSGPATLRLLWSAPGLPREVVPAGQLFPSIL